MNVTAMGKAGLTGWRGKVGGRVAERVSERTRLTRDQVEAIIGALFLAVSAYHFIKLVRRVLEAGREEETA